ncbi:MAG: hypothetical protein J5653_04700 [Clostridiales bacterium]|nr:hypothetical protein [Clostridiales bacterium]
MFKRDNRVHKRPLLTAVTVFVIFLLVASILFVSLGILRKSSEFPKVSTQNEKSGVNTSGLGVNLSYVPSTNLVFDPSFESSYNEDVFSVAEASENVVYLHNRSDEDAMPSGSYKNGKLRILSYDEDGQLKQVVNAGILDFQTEQLGIWRPIDSSEQGNLFASIVRTNGAYVAALLESGELIGDVTSAEPVKVLTPVEGDPIVDVSVFNGHYYAVTAHGSFLVSANGRSWDSVLSSEDSDFEIRALTSLGKQAVACGTNGTVKVCGSSSITSPMTGTANDLLTAVSDGSRVLLAGENGYVCTSVNASMFRKISKDELETVENETWVLSAYNNGEFILIDNRGQVAIGKYDDSSDKFAFDRYDGKLPDNVVPKQISMFQGGDIWVLTDNGHIYSFSRSAGTWHQVFAGQENKITSICGSSDESILIARAGSISSASMYTKVTLDREIGDIEVQNGDMCILFAPVPSVSSDGNNAWDVFGSDTFVQIASDAPKMAGVKSLHLSSSNPDKEEAHFISQVISRDELNPMKEKVFYNVRLWLKSSNIENDEVIVWISGLSEPIGTTFTDVNGNWKEYSYTFAWPSQKVDLEKTEIRLNIGFYGSGEMFTDVIRLERDTYSDPVIKPQLVDLLTDSHPEFLRLENLGLGRNGRHIASNISVIGNEYVYDDEEGNLVDSGVVSLESTMRLVKQVDADPWLVIDSSFDADETEVLLGYMCGGITDTYGKLRVDNGTAVPWNKQFDRVMIEIADHEGLFETDLQRRAYVDYMISLISNSRYYSELKDNVFFIDGMKYESGTMTSVADYHASVLGITNAGVEAAITLPEEDNTTLIETAYTNYVDAIPRNTSYMQESTGEWISDLSFSVVQNRVSENRIYQDEKSLSAAEMIDFLLKDLGVHTSFVTVDLPVSRSGFDANDDYLFANDEGTLENRKVKSANTETLLRLVGVLTEVASGQRIETSWTAPLSHKKDENYSVDLHSYAYTSNGYIYLIITNPTQEQQQFLIESNASDKDISVSRYSAECKKIALASKRGFLNLGDRKYTLQAGQFCIAVIPV